MNKKIETPTDRSTFTTTISKAIVQDFKIACIKNNENMNTAIERFMTEYTEKVNKGK